MTEETGAACRSPPLCPHGYTTANTPSPLPHSAQREPRIPLSQAEEKTRVRDTSWGASVCPGRQRFLHRRPTQARRQRPNRLNDSSEGLKMAPVGEENHRETAQQTLAGSQTAPSSRLCPTLPRRHSRSAQAGSGARPQLRQPSAPRLGVSQPGAVQGAGKQNRPQHLLPSPAVI